MGDTASSAKNAVDYLRSLNEQALNGQLVASEIGVDDKIFGGPRFDQRRLVTDEQWLLWIVGIHLNREVVSRRS